MPVSETKCFPQGAEVWDKTTTIQIWGGIQSYTSRLPLKQQGFLVCPAVPPIPPPYMF